MRGQMLFELYSRRRGQDLFEKWYMYRPHPRERWTPLFILLFLELRHRLLQKSMIGGLKACEKAKGNACGLSAEYDPRL